MKSSRMRIALAALTIVGWVAALPAGVANADCTTAGDFGAGAGCAPPGDSSGGGKTDSWPPTSVDWPPQLNSDSGGTNGDKGDADAASTPIVMPNGQKPPPKTSSNSTSTSAPPKPIVPVGSAPVATTPSTSTTPTPIVPPHS